MGKLIHLDSIVESLRNPWGEPDPGLEAVSKAAAEAYELSNRAYGSDDAEAWEQAERLLYFINSGHAFANPVHAIGSVVWTTLMRAKLRHARTLFGGCEPVDTAEMTRRLEQAVAAYGAYNHPVLAKLKNGNLDHYQIWAKNWYGSCYGFSHQLASLVQRTHGEAKRVVLENLSDEFDHKVTHDEMRLRFYESIGLRFEPDAALDEADRTAEATSLLNLRTGLCSISDPYPALGCFYTVEANWPPECRLHIDLNRARGLDDHTLQYWTEHGLADESHSADWLRVVQASCRSDEQRAGVVDGGVIQLRVRWAMYDAIERRIDAAS